MTKRKYSVCHVLPPRLESAFKKSHSTFPHHPNTLSRQTPSPVRLQLPKFSTKMSFYDEIELEDLTYHAATQLYTYPCPCGDQFEISLADMRDGEDVAVCPSCSLQVRVIFDVVSGCFPWVSGTVIWGGWCWEEITVKRRKDGGESGESGGGNSRTRLIYLCVFRMIYHLIRTPGLLPEHSRLRSLREGG